MSTGAAWALATNPQTNMIYVTDGVYAGARAIDGTTDQVVAYTGIQGLVNSVAVDTNTNTVFYASGNSAVGETVAVDGATNQIVHTFQGDTGDVSIALSDKANLLYVSDSAWGTINIYNASTYQQVATISIPSPEYLALNENADLLYALSITTSGTYISVIDAVTDQVKATIPLPNGLASSVTYNPDTNEIYAGQEIIDAGTLQQIGTLGVGYNDLAVDPSTDLLFASSDVMYTSVPHSNDINQLAVIDGATNTVVQILPLEAPAPGYNSPNFVAVNPDTHAVYVGNSGVGVVEVFTPQEIQQTISFTSTPPSEAVVGGSPYNVTATGGSSGNPIVFSVDPSSTSGCSISGSTVSFDTPAGTCFIDANQAGGNGYTAAPQVEQAIGVSPDVVSFTPPDASAGAMITVTGAGFTSASNVTVDGIPATFAVVSDTSIELVVPDGALSGPIAVTANEQTGQTSGVFIVDPTVGPISGLPTDPEPIDSSVTGSVSFTAPANTTSSATWNWGDGSTSTGTVTESNGSGSVTGSHIYASAGVYAVKVTIADSDGGVGTTSDTESVVIYDPSGGFVTGGGWITSPSGACLDSSTCGNSTGKATFGFVSRYAEGATVPSGNTQYIFRDGNLEFTSSSYQWLIVNQAGTNAQFKGNGTINGTGDYTFMIWATESSPDTLRMQISDSATGEVVYDTGTQSLGGGSIIIHTS